MKRTKIFLILFIAAIGLSAINETKAQSVAVNFSLFQQELNPYGRWMTNPRFGEVWIYNDPSFRPYYSDGHWDYTNYGWEWVSDFDWGWAPFHYGRWEYDPSYGWMWIPGYDWGAAWVSWSAYDDYYGWAPLGYGVDISVGFGSIPYDRWTFIPRANICDRDINRYYISPDRNRGFRNAVVINNFYEGNGGRGRFMRGPDRNEVERYTHNRIQERRIDDREREGRWIANNDNGRRNDRNNGFNNGGRRNDQQQGGVNNNDNNRNNDRNNNGFNNGGRNNDQVRGNNNGNNNWNRRGNDQNANNGNQQGNQNVPGRRPDVVDNNRQPNRDVNTNPRQNGNWSNDNRGNRQQNDFPQQRQQVERPARQQQQQQPAMQQRSMERRDYGGGAPRSNNNGQGNNDNHGGGGGGRNRRG